MHGKFDHETHIREKVICHLENRMTVPNQSSGMLLLSSPRKALNEWLVPACAQPNISMPISKHYMKKKTSYKTVLVQKLP